MDVVRLASRNSDQAKNAGKYSLQLAYRSKPRPRFDCYVASGFITAYDFSGEDGQFGEPQTPEDYSEENAVLTVVLVLVIVVLVIAGVAYLAYTGSAGKRKKERDGYKKMFFHRRIA